MANSVYNVYRLIWYTHHRSYTRILAEYQFQILQVGAHKPHEHPMNISGQFGRIAGDHRIIVGGVIPLGEPKPERIAHPIWRSNVQIQPDQTGLSIHLPEWILNLICLVMKYIWIIICPRVFPHFPIFSHIFPHIFPFLSHIFPIVSGKATVSYRKSPWRTSWFPHQKLILILTIGFPLGFPGLWGLFSLVLFRGLKP